MNDQPQTPTPATQDKSEGAAGLPVSETPSVSSQQSPAPGMPPKDSKKMHTIVLVVIGGLLVLGIAAAIVYFIFFYVSKADYKSAENKTNAVITAYHKVDDALQEWASTAADTSASDRDIASKKAAYNDAATAYKSAANDLSDMRALKDNKVKSVYDAFVMKNNVAMADNESFTDAMPKFRTAKLACDNADIGNVDTNDLSTIADTWDKAFAPCITATKALSGVKNVSMAAVGKSMQAYYEEMRADIVALQKAYIAKDEAAFMKAYNGFTGTVDKYNSDESLKNAKKYQDTLLPQTALDNLLKSIRSRE